jgi:hypothetical protein
MKSDPYESHSRRTNTSVFFFILCVWRIFLFTGASDGIRSCGIGYMV